MQTLGNLPRLGLLSRHAVVIVTKAKTTPNGATALMVSISEHFRMEEAPRANRGTEKIVDALEEDIDERNINVTLERGLFMGHCQRGSMLHFAPSGRSN